MADCPLSAAISMTNVDCITNIESVAKYLVRRQNQSEISQADLKSKTAVDLLIAKTDSSKLIVLPKIFNNTIEPGGAIDDDKVYLGQPTRVGEEATTVNQMVMLDQPTYAEIKDLEGEDLEVFMISENNNIHCKYGTSTTSVSSESVTITALGVKYELANKKIKSGTVVVKDSSGSTTYTETTDYTINYVTGQITGVTGGSISAGDVVKVSYDCYNVEGFPIYGLFLASKAVKGHGTADENAMTFNLGKSWNKKEIVIKGDDCDYEPLYDLEN